MTMVGLEIHHTADDGPKFEGPTRTVLSLNVLAGKKEDGENMFCANGTVTGKGMSIREHIEMSLTGIAFVLTGIDRLIDRIPVATIRDLFVSILPLEEEFSDDEVRVFAKGVCHHEMAKALRMYLEHQGRFGEYQMAFLKGSDHGQQMGESPEGAPA